MTKPQKVITIALWIAAVGMMVGVVALKSLPASRPPSVTEAQADGQTPNGASSSDAISAGTVLAESPDTLVQMGTVPPFTLIDQDNKTTGSSDLLGHPWVADFIFTNCASTCPLMSAKMMDLQTQLPKQIKLVSFSVDPQNDTPAVLKQYGAKYQAQPGRWMFLTGDAKTQEAVIRGLKLIFSPATANQPIAHDEHFVLVDSRGEVRGYYRMDRMDQLVRDAQELARQDGVN
jgi:protein SCO1